MWHVKTREIMQILRVLKFLFLCYFYLKFDPHHSGQLSTES